MLMLGINEGFDASVVLSRDGTILFAVQEERLTREKGTIGFPTQAVLHCIKQYDLSAYNLHHVCLSNLCSPKSETRNELLLEYARRGRSGRELLHMSDLSGSVVRLAGMLPGFIENRMRGWHATRRGATNNRMITEHLARCGLDGIPVSRFHHHSNHAASAYYGLRKNWHEPHLVFTLDGGGDDACAHVYMAENGALRLLASTPTGHSLGNVYAAVTHMLGMRPHEHEYKVMGLAPYADPEQAGRQAQTFARYLDLDPANLLRFRRTIPERTSAILPRLLQDFRLVRFDLIAAGLQRFTEDLLVRWIAAAMASTGVRKVLGAGGVFMNVKANQHIAELPGLEYFDVFPSCGDETLPFGAVWQCHVRHGGALDDIRFDHLYLGPDAGTDVSEARARYGQMVEFQELDDPELRTAELLAQGRIVARCSGRMEFGARALGNRSILADPSRPSVVQTINRLIKQRDFWMPFAPAVLGERAGQYVHIPLSLPQVRISPHMMHAFHTTEQRAELAAAVHCADATARAQMVWKELTPSFYRLIEAFGRLTGRWVVLNTSFNLHGFPIVGGACDAIDVFLKSGLDDLVVDRWLIRKRETRTVGSPASGPSRGELSDQSQH
ncbi:MAG TPA: carbamoyltransferase C-terminal domain-containing protein [Nitrospira sp.]|nr:carbamoyltransferase C-terminal domain-containing protein [Nitrospira sp.]HUM39134.1 carbamoyltransferase C-terminal domain-containing protein [Nitrospira sp.]